MEFQPTLPVRGATVHLVQRASHTQFQPTLPVRGATYCPRRGNRRARHFNPRSPCGERPASHSSKLPLSYFNPRSPCGERQAPHSSSSGCPLFQPTLPVRGATASTNKFEALILYHKYNFGIIP